MVSNSPGYYYLRNPSTRKLPLGIDHLKVALSLHTTHKFSVAPPLISRPRLHRRRSEAGRKKLMFCHITIDLGAHEGITRYAATGELPTFVVRMYQMHRKCTPTKKPPTRQFESGASI